MKYLRFLLVLLSLPLTIITVIVLIATVPEVLAMPKLRVIGREAIARFSVPPAKSIFYLARETDIEMAADDLLGSLQFVVSDADGNQIAVEPYKRFFFGRKVEGVTYFCVSVFRLDGNVVPGPVRLESNIASLPNVQWAYSEGSFLRLILVIILTFGLYTSILIALGAKLFKTSS